MMIKILFVVSLAVIAAFIIDGEDKNEEFF